MDIITLCSRIRMPEPIVQRLSELLEALPMDPDSFHRLMTPATGLQGYQELCAFLGEDPEGIRQLACQLHCACLRYASYRQLGIPEDIYFATMSCYTRFVTECLYYKGSYQFDRGWWTWRQLGLVLFRLGSLEFELKADGTVAIHIPSGTDLSPAAVEQSLNMATAFLSEFFPERRAARFTCNSWLLSPALEDLLSPQSNIRSFQKRFRILSTDPEAGDYISWLFQRLPDAAPETLPEETSLQKRTKQFLLAGGKIGSAAGELIQ